MSDPTSLLFDLPGFRVLDVQPHDQQDRQVLIETTAGEGGCPSCGVVSRRVHDRPVAVLRDVRFGERDLLVLWRKRRWKCLEVTCPRRSFTEAAEAVRPRGRVTERLRRQAAEAVAGGNRSVAEVADAHGLGWATVHRAFVELAARLLPEPPPTRQIGIDETRARSVRWLLAEHGWQRSDPWMTSIVDLDPAGAGAVLGLAPGRSGGCVKDWLLLQSQEFRDAVELAVIDPSAPYAAGLRAALPGVRIAVDHWHLVRLANQTVTEVRQRAQREQTGRRGGTADPKWANRRLLLRGGETLSPRALARLRATFAADDPTGELQAAWAVKERLRQLLALPAAGRADRHSIAAALQRFYDTAATADMPETTRLASTVQYWWPEVLTFLLTGVTNARTEGFNRVIKQVKRVGCGFRNQDNYQRRIMCHIAATRAA